MRIKFKVIFCMLLFAISNVSLIYANPHINDAFVLVDVSGSMSNHQTNQQAKKLISDMLLGNFDVNQLSNGWTKQIDQNCPLFRQTKFLNSESHLFLVPFGNCERMRDYTTLSVKELPNVFLSKFPSHFNDQYTYLSLTRAFVVDLAIKRNIDKEVYLIIYSDGKGDSQQSISYPEDLQKIHDNYGTSDNSYSQKLGVIRKKIGSKRNYDIEIWKLGPIRYFDTPQKTDIPQQKEQKKIAILTPNKGSSPKHPLELDVDQKLKLTWKDFSGRVKLNIKRKDGDKYNNIKKVDQKDFYKLTKSNYGASVNFVQGGDYQIIVADESSNDSRYVSVSAPILAKVLPFIIVIVLCLGGFYIWKLISHTSPHKSSSQRTEKKASSSDNIKNDDW